jgi:hypothetical protein
MPAEQVEYVKPPFTPSKDAKLTLIGSMLLVAGLLFAAQVPSNASSPISNPVVTDGAALSWTGAWQNYVQGDTSNGPPQTQVGNMMELCSYNESVALTAQVCRNGNLTSMSFSSGRTSNTFYSDDEYRTRQGVAASFGTNRYVVQFVHYNMTTYDANYVPEYVGDPLVIQASGPRPRQQNNQTPRSPSVSAPADSAPAPTVEIKVSGVASASSLLAGKRDFTFEGENMKEVVAIRVNGASLGLFDRTDTSLKVRLPKLAPGKYDVIVYTPTANWTVPGAVEIGELLPIVREEPLDESFEKNSSELPKQTKSEIRAVLEATPTLRKITVTAIARREIVREDGNKLARARAEAALDYIRAREPNVKIETRIVHFSETTLTSRGLFFKVAQKKQ